MKGLMFICKNWGEENCHSDISKFRYAKELEEGESIPLWPVGNELKKLDEICKRCESRYFNISKKECPVCGSSDFLKISGAKIENVNDKIKKVDVSFLTCNQCKSHLILTELY
jgi:ribosomal protein L37E